MDVKAAARAAFDRVQDEVLDLSRQIHAHPELKFEEERACVWVAEALAAHGFAIEPGICELPTAFNAQIGSGPLQLAICAEYDALPHIGHACGHNLIAAMAVGAGVALAEVADEVGLTVNVIGTPAEEGGGGKILLLQRGGFDGIHAAMMVHPCPWDLVELPIIAAEQFKAHYTGKEAHASAFPELGINAADALVIAQTAIGLLRQHIRPSDRIHGIITKGGDAPNVVPAHTTCHYMVRARTTAELDEIRTKVLRCFEAGALGTGASLDVETLHDVYAEMHHDSDMAALYRRNAEALGRTFPEFTELSQRIAVSTDMGNVSLAIPSIHPAIDIDSLPAVNHQPEFAAHCVTEAAHHAVVDGAVAMAWTAIDMATDDGLRRRLLKHAHAARSPMQKPRPEPQDA